MDEKDVDDAIERLAEIATCEGMIGSEICRVIVETGYTDDLLTALKWAAVKVAKKRTYAVEDLEDYVFVDVLMVRDGEKVNWGYNFLKPFVEWFKGKIYNSAKERMYDVWDKERKQEEHLKEGLNKGKLIVKVVKGFMTTSDDASKSIEAVVPSSNVLSDMEEWLLVQIEKLSPRDQHIIKSKYYDNVESQEEIAQVVGTSQETVSRVLKKFREELKVSWEADFGKGTFDDTKSG